LQRQSVFVLVEAVADDSSASMNERLIGVRYFDYAFYEQKGTVPLAQSETLFH
jgi:hypothetical protein